MTKEQQEHIANMLRHASYKKYENYILSGIYWSLRNAGVELELITQQTVFRQNAKNNVAYLDGYFPALNLQIEVDEAQHKAKVHKENDTKRENDIMKVLGALSIDPDVIRIDATKNLDEQIENTTKAIIERYNILNKPIWTNDNPCDKIKKNGCLKFSDNSIFKFKNDLVNALGLRTHLGKEYSKTGTQSISLVTMKSGDDIWFPCISDNMATGWLNSYDTSRHIFKTQLVNNFKRNPMWVRMEQLFKEGKSKDRFIIFKVIDAFNNRGYKYYGKYRITYCDAKTQTEIWERISTEDLKIQE